MEFSFNSAEETGAAGRKISHDFEEDPNEGKNPAKRPRQPFDEAPRLSPFSRQAILERLSAKRFDDSSQAPSQNLDGKTMIVGEASPIFPSHKTMVVHQTAPCGLYSQPTPGETQTLSDLADVAVQHRKIFSSDFFVGKRLKRSEDDSPSSSSRFKLFRSNSTGNVSVVDLCSSDDDESFQRLAQEKNKEGKQPALASTTDQQVEDSAEAQEASDEEKKKSTKDFILGNISVDRKRLLLDVLAPITLSPEAMNYERWMSTDIASPTVSKAFSQRFGCLEVAELEQLANGDFFVPEGMVSVRETLRAYRLSLSKKTEPSFAETLEKTLSEVDALLGETDGPLFCGEERSVQTSVAEETSGENQFFANTNFAWNGTFQFISKDQADTKPSSSDSTLPKASADNCSDDNLDESLLKNLQEQQGLQEIEPLIDSEGNVEGKPSSLDGENQDDGSEEDETEMNDVLVPYVPKNIGTEANEIVPIAEPDTSLIDNNAETPLDDQARTKEDIGVESGSNDPEEFINNSIVEYSNNEQEMENQEGGLPESREVRAILGDIVTNMVGVITSQFRQEQDRLREEINMNNLIEDDDGSKSFSEASDNDEDEVGDSEENRPLIVVSAKQLVLLALPLICLAFIVRRFGMLDISNSIFEGSFRTIVQLHILGSMLSPIFNYGADRPVLVGCYALFMIVVASYEASSRTKYTHDGQFTIIVESLILSVGWVAMWAFGAILKPKPMWNPRYLLPIVGMLLGNSINGISSTLDIITTSLVEKQSEVDLYLSFGADQYEAVSGIVVQAIQKGMTPKLNMMCVVGIVSIPGMMTGQILGGSSPMVAARYQAMIIFLIVLSSLSTILVSSFLTVTSAFCSHQILRPDNFVKNRKRGIARLILWLWGYIFGGGNDSVPVGSNMVSGNLLAGEELNKAILLPTTGFEIRSLKRGSVVSNNDGMNSLIQVAGLNRYFSVEGDSDQCSENDNQRTLFSDLSFLVNEGDLLLVSGPSGTGKSQLLRMMAGLNPLQEGDLLLQGKSWKDEFEGNTVVEWRQQVRYVTQSKIQIPGTPLQFIKKIQSFRSWNLDGNRKEIDFMKHISHHLRQWGMGLDSLNKDWAVLSGGESQRVLMAISLASRPKLLLFDESTSALDYESKLAVEASINDFVDDHQGGVIWVSHDAQQVERMTSH